MMQGFGRWYYALAMAVIDTWDSVALYKSFTQSRNRMDRTGHNSPSHDYVIMDLVCMYSMWLSLLEYGMEL